MLKRRQNSSKKRNFQRKHRKLHQRRSPAISFSLQKKRIIWHKTLPSQLIRRKIWWNARKRVQSYFKRHKKNIFWQLSSCFHSKIQLNPSSQSRNLQLRRNQAREPSQTMKKPSKLMQLWQQRHFVQWRRNIRLNQQRGFYIDIR